MYYLPYAVQSNYGGYGGDYLRVENTADAEWMEKHDLMPTELGQGKCALYPKRRYWNFKRKRTD